MSHDPVSRQVEDVLARLSAGEPPSTIEDSLVDIKEEPGRRDSTGNVLPGEQNNEDAAKYLAGEMACFANSPGGGAIVLGVADKGLHIGTALDPEWLRRRIYELTNRQLTVNATDVVLNGVRLLVLTTHSAVEPIRYGGRLRWRVDDSCVEMDATTWHADARRRSGYDWSTQPSDRHTLADVSAGAVEVARNYLREAAEAGDEAAGNLMTASDADLLRRIHVLDQDGRLTNAGSLLFVGTPDNGIDYIRRDYPAANSTARVRSTRPLLQQIADVEMASDVANRIVHIGERFAHGQTRAIPSRALRESIINGVVHRNWLLPQPTTVEHVGDQVTVTSPGGFIGSIGPSNIITHPSTPRYRSLAEAVASLRLAEREGVGIDRMVRDMLARGHAEPEIAEIPGPYVRVSLIGGEPDAEMVAFLASLEPPQSAQNVDCLLLLHHLVRFGWTDVTQAGPVLQRNAAETAIAITNLANTRAADSPVIVQIAGVPSGQLAGYRLSDSARKVLRSKLSYLTSPEHRTAMIARWAEARGRVSSTEVADIADITTTYAGSLLADMAVEGPLKPGRENKRGRGFFYIPEAG